KLERDCSSGDRRNRKTECEPSPAHDRLLRLIPSKAAMQEAARGCIWLLSATRANGLAPNFCGHAPSHLVGGAPLAAPHATVSRSRSPVNAPDGSPPLPAKAHP